MKTYMCPECGEELTKGAICPQCNHKAKSRDLFKEAVCESKSIARRKAKYGKSWRLFKF